MDEDLFLLLSINASLEGGWSDSTNSIGLGIKEPSINLKVDFVLVSTQFRSRCHGKVEWSSKHVWHEGVWIVLSQLGVEGGNDVIDFLAELFKSLIDSDLDEVIVLVHNSLEEPARHLQS